MTKGAMYSADGKLSAQIPDYVLKFDSFVGGEEELDMENVGALVVEGQQESPSKSTLPEYDPTCYLCPKNKRAQGDQNPDYKNTFVFVNDYSAVKESQAEYSPQAKDGDLSSLLLRAKPVTGKCYVLTFSPQHNLTLADLTPTQILPVVQMWTKIYAAHLSPKSPLYSLQPAGSTASDPDYGVSAPTAQYR
ncbi:hypothetical protein VE00_10474 [Pseudogymnoascus sp. WSF 3629]|nr:hypothetical protein VE00_10474 [Pseudogymnoascus sp. WSF 3629]